MNQQIAPDSEKVIKKATGHLFVVPQRGVAPLFRTKGQMSQGGVTFTSTRSKSMQMHMNSRANKQFKQNQKMISTINFLATNQSK